MPQPIHYQQTIEHRFDESAVMERPKLAPYIAGISAHWNEIEARLAIFLAALLEGESKTVMSIYLALRSDHAKKSITDTVASLKLKPPELLTFQKIQDDIGKRYAERNAVIHGSWGVSPKYPDALLWIDPRDTHAMFPELMRMDYREKLAAINAAQTKMLVYVEKDFQDILDRMKATHKNLYDFSHPAIKPWMNLHAKLT